MSAFAKFGIEHLSPSSLNLWREHPARWSVQYLLKVRDPDNSKTIRGKAVEVGMGALLKGTPMRDSLSHALANYDLNASLLLSDALGEIPDDLDKQRNLIKPMLAQIGLWVDFWRPRLIGEALTQVRVEVWLDDVPVPLIGFIDFLFAPAGIFDLKTTQQMPPNGQARPGHVRQMAVYRAARDAPTSLLYVTDKRHAEIPVTVEQCAIALQELRTDAKRLEAFLGVAKDAKHALSILPLNTDDRYLSEKTKEAYYAAGDNNDKEGLRQWAEQAG